MSDMDDLGTALASREVTQAEIDALVPPFEKPSVRLKALPLATLGACKEAAMSADWPLRRWVEFSKAARRWLDADASEEADARFEHEVRKRFTVS